ncbi:MAG: lantibiotic dehydratase [Proteobacteria bacterium]|nr:lantibiotic dehydratase [Pseudomonadota bacterium]
MPVTRAPSLLVGDGFVLRTPALPMTFAAWAAGGVDGARAYVTRLLALPEVREALFVASPSLHAAIDGWRDAPTSAAGQRVERSLVKYLARMMGRSTPFGLFSAVSAGQIDRTTSLALAARTSYQRRTRLDNDYLFVLTDALARTPDARAKLRYRPNTSSYRTAGWLRYAAAHASGKVRRYSLISVELTSYLDGVLAVAASAPTGATRAQLVASLGAEVDADEAGAYVDELIDAQLVVPELGVFVTGPEPLDGLLAQLRAAGLAEPWAILDRTRAQLAALDVEGLGHAPERYTAIAADLEPLTAKVDLARLFQIDMVKPAAATLARRVATDVARVISQLALIIPRHDPTFDEFKRGFRARYEDQEVPLALALDEEAGLGFEASRAPGAEGAPLLAWLGFPARASDATVRWMKLERHMLRRLATALVEGAQEIVLAHDELVTLELATQPPLPDALSAMIRISAATPDASPTILFEHASGPSGAKALGRFCHASPEIAEIVRAHHAAEEALAPDTVYAEIVHLNEGRIGNIICRPVLRGHEIVYLGVSGAPREVQLTIDDLLVSLRDDRVVLTSRRLGVEVVPRLTTAHNFRLRSLGVYRFLCALSGQGAMGVSWSWGALASAPFLPRVRIGEVIVERARWRLDRRELTAITAAVRAANKDPARQDDVLAAVAALRTARSLPRMFVLAESDHELPVDLDNPLLAAAFADEISNQEEVVLIELFPLPDQLVVQGPEGGYANEILLTYVRAATPASAPKPRPRASQPKLRRTFRPGSEWLYAKIYCGSTTADRVLTEVIAPVVREAIAAGDVRQWFFLRYRDPEHHVRVRFAGDPAALLGRVLPALERSLAPLAEAGVISNLQLDSYVRELERYGGDRGMELVEQIFWRDSEAVLAIVELLEGEAGEIARWQLAVSGIDAMFDTLGLTPTQRVKIVSDGRDMLGREMNAGTPLWAQIGARFVRERADLDVMFDRDSGRDADHDLEPGLAILAARDAALQDLGVELRRRDAAGELAPRLAEFAWSLAHMHANRMLHASQRAQEMVLYDFLKRLYASRRARQPVAG